MRSAVLDVDPLMGLAGGVLHNAGYVRADLGAEFALTREVALYGRLFNFIDSRYEEALGFPALRRNFVAGVKFRWR
jgi:outer membrane cobalamin receptor